MEITKEFSFDAAHRLAFVPAGHPCRSLHGHRYKVTIRLSVSGNEMFSLAQAEKNMDDGLPPVIMLYDYRNLKQIKEWIDENYDHALLVSVHDRQLQKLIKLDKAEAEVNGTEPIFKKYTLIPIVETTSELMAIHMQGVFETLLNLPRYIKIGVTVQETPNTSATVN